MPTFQEQVRALRAITEMSSEIIELRQEALYHRRQNRLAVAKSVEGEVYLRQAKLEQAIETARQNGFYEVVTNQISHNPKFDRLDTAILH